MYQRFEDCAWKVPARTFKKAAFSLPVEGPSFLEPLLCILLMPSECSERKGRY